MPIPGNGTESLPSEELLLQVKKLIYLNLKNLKRKKKILRKISKNQEHLKLKMLVVLMRQIITKTNVKESSSLELRVLLEQIIRQVVLKKSLLKVLVLVVSIKEKNQLFKRLSLLKKM